MMSDSDRIEKLERTVAELARQLAGMPVRLGDAATGGAGGTETLGCYLTRSGGDLTINLGALFSSDFIIGEETPCPLIYADPLAFTGPQGPQGDPGTPATPNTEGYCIEIDTNTLHVDMITTAAGTAAVDRDLTKLQVWAHFAGASARTDAKWKTIDNYNAADLCAGLFHFEGDWEWANFQSYSATEFQFFVNDNDDFDFKTLTGYTAMNHQVIWHENGTWKALDIPETGIKLLGSDAGTLQFFDVADFSCPE